MGRGWRRLRQKEWEAGVVVVVVRLKIVSELEANYGGYAPPSLGTASLGSYCTVTFRRHRIQASRWDLLVLTSPVCKWQANISEFSSITALEFFCIERYLLKDYEGRRRGSLASS